MVKMEMAKMEIVEMEIVMEMEIILAHSSVS